MNYFSQIRLLRWTPALLLPFAIIPGSRCQAPPQSGPAELQSVGSLDASSIVRQFDDPSSGARWLLVRKGDRPGGPGRMVLVPPKDGSARSPDLHKFPAPDSFVLVIRAGDSIVVEEHTGVADTRLQAVALGPARSGATLRVRLKLGGRILRAVASGPGRATLAPDTEAWP
jgi:hypothetical protein